VTLDAHDEAVRQVAVADRIVLSKTELAPDGPLRRRIERLNPGARILDAAKGEAKAAALTGTGPFGPEARGAHVRAWLAAEAYANDHHHADEDVNRHDAHIAAFALASDGAMRRRDVDRFLDELELGFASKLIRMKGIVALRDYPDMPIVIQAVQGTFSPPAMLDRWPDADRRSRVVFIGRDLDRRPIETLLDAFTGTARIDAPDREALLDNPLVAAGFTDRTMR
jgi:G3E family GTPase